MATAFVESIDDNLLLHFLQKTPSQHCRELEKPDTSFFKRHGAPRIIQLLDISDYTHQTECCVDMDTPLFQPSPQEIVFHKYEPFQEYRASLCLRNVDKAR